MPNALAYYPNEKYIKNNWAPENVNPTSLANLANAQRIAQRTGLMSPSVASKMLANALIEGHSNYGVVDGTYGYPPNKIRDEYVHKMGLTTANSDAPNVLKKWAHVLRDTKDGYILNNRSQANYAKMAALVLAEKARLYGDDKAIERWNGQGRAIEENYGDLVQADAPNHARKFQEMTRMLQHPKNALLRKTYEQMLKGQ